MVFIGLGTNKADILFDQTGTALSRTAQIISLDELRRTKNPQKCNDLILPRAVSI